MKVRQLLENEEEPIALTIMRRAISKGEPVRMYWRGDGGIVTRILWDCNNDQLNTGLATFYIRDDGHDRPIYISGLNLDAMILKKRAAFGGAPASLVFKKPEAIDEAKAPPEWAAAEQAEFNQFVKQFGFQLTTRLPDKGNLDGDAAIGGKLKDLDKDELLGKEHRLQALKKALAGYLLKKAKEDRMVKIFKATWWNTSLRYIHAEDDIRAAERAVNDVVYYQTDRYDHDGRKKLAIHWAISPPKP